MCWDLESLQDLSKYFHCNYFADKDLRYFIYREDPFLNQRHVSQTGYRNVFNGSCEYDRKLSKKIKILGRGFEHIIAVTRLEGSSDSGEGRQAVRADA